MKVDSLFHKLLKAYPAILFELIGLPGNEAKEYCFDAVEIKETQHRFDGVLKKTFKEVVISKLPNLSREKLEQMLGLADLKETRIYQEGREEGREEGRLKAKLEAVPRLLERGLGADDIAYSLGLREESMETGLEAIPQLLKDGLGVEIIADLFKLEVGQVHQIASQYAQKS